MSERDLLAERVVNARKERERERKARLAAMPDYARRILIAIADIQKEARAGRAMPNGWRGEDYSWAVRTAARYRKAMRRYRKRPARNAECLRAVLIEIMDRHYLFPGPGQPVAPLPTARKSRD